MIFLKDINSTATFQNFSETKPNFIDPKVGDWGQFWKDQTHEIATYGKIGAVDRNAKSYECRYYCQNVGYYKYFSHEKPDFL